MDIITAANTLVENSPQMKELKAEIDELKEEAEQNKQLFNTTFGELMKVKEENKKLKKNKYDKYSCSSCKATFIGCESNIPVCAWCMKEDIHYRKLKEENEKLKKENMSIQYEYFDKTGENYDPKFDGIWSKSENSDEIIEALALTMSK